MPARPPDYSGGMTQSNTSPIARAIANLNGRQPRQRGRKAELAPFVPQIRELLARGWTRAEILGEIRAMGGKVSPALLRDVLALQTNDKKRRRRRSPEVDEP